MQRSRFAAPILAALLAVSVVPSVAFAQTAQPKEEIERARTLFRDGLALSAAQDWTGALAKFKQVAQVKMTPQVAFNIAECEEHLGRLVSALGNYRLAASEAEAAKAAEVAAQVGDRITALEERIPKLMIERGEGAENASIELDGAEVSAGQLGVAMPMDPGKHVIVGKIDGREGTRETVELAERDDKKFTVVIDLEMLTPVKPPPVAPPPVKDKVEPADPTMAYVVTGAGGVSLAAGVVFMILRSGTISDLDAVCKDGHCPASAESTADSGKLYTGLAEVTIPLGVVGVAAGVYMLMTQPSADAEPAVSTGRARSPRGFAGVDVVSTAPGADVGGASLVGRF